MSEKRGTTIRLGVNTRDLLKNAGRILGRSNSDIVEEALMQWLSRNNMLEAYQVTVTDSNIILSEHGNELKILEVTERNGIPPQQVAQNYKKQLQAPVRLVIQEGENQWLKNKS